MKLALRHALPPDAGALSQIGTAIIETRLVTRYAHAGVVIGGMLYHANAAHGVHAEPAGDMAGWLLIDLGDADDARALKLFSAVVGKGYDWVSLTAFVLEGATDSQRWYCYELCWLLLTGEAPRVRVTAEDLLVLALQKLGHTGSDGPHVRSVTVEVPK